MEVTRKTSPKKAQMNVAATKIVNSGGSRSSSFDRKSDSFVRALKPVQITSEKDPFDVSQSPVRKVIIDSLDDYTNDEICPEEVKQ